MRKIIKYFYYDDFTTNERIVDIFIGAKKIKLRLQERKLYELMNKIEKLKRIIKRLCGGIKE